MKARAITISRIITILILGLLLGFAAHRQHVKQGQLGRTDFLAKQAARFDKDYATPPPPAVEMLVGLFVAGIVFGTYELIVLVLSKVLQKIDDDGLRAP